MTRENSLVKNEILRLQSIKEETAQKTWHEKWKFYLDFDKILLEEAQKIGITEEKYSKHMKFRKARKKADPAFWKLAPVETFPKTSAGVVGWRKIPDHSLERVGPLYVSPKSTLPQDLPYKHIILG